MKAKTLGPSPGHAPFVALTLIAALTGHTHNTTDVGQEEAWWRVGYAHPG
jgi:hypothetical protein